MREERLRTTAGLRSTPALALSAWRGRSGKRYVVGIHALSAPELDEMGEAVIIAVRRDPAGIAEQVAVSASGEGPRERLSRTWLAHARKGGATEMHVHRLADGEAARLAIVEDLRIEDADPALA